MTYKIKKLILGQEIGPQYSGFTLVGVPNKKAKKGTKVTFGKDTMTLPEKALTNRTFPDKFGREQTYTLYYYIWRVDTPKLREEARASSLFS